MLDLDKIDFKKMGFRAGLEVHHQIDTKRKLFCNCEAKLSNGEPDYRFERYFRPVLGEMGDFDAGMLIEFEKGYRVIYHAFEETVCCYEQDEQPPFWPDLKAIYKGYELAHWLNFTALVDEVVVSRKQYLDGSITTGFQRTMIVARDGYVPINGKKIRLSNLTVEEDAARKIKTENFGRTVYYNLDRLGIPLVEVITDHRDCDNPYDLQRLAEYIGLTLRLSGIGRRGIGTVRQDVNISISGGNRVEIKGVQDLNSFVKLAKREVARQDMLLRIKKELEERALRKKELEHTYTDFTELFDQKLILSGGFRYDSYDVKVDEPKGRDESDDNVSLSFGVAYLVKDFIKLRFNYGEAFVMPAADQMAADYVVWGTHYLGNSGLSPETSRTYEGGIDIFYGSLETSLTYFYTDFDDKIEPVSKPGWIKTWENIGSATLHGIEGKISWDIARLFGWDFELRPYASFVYLPEYENNETHEDIKYVSDINASYGITLSDLYGLSATLNFAYTGKQNIDDWENVGPPTWTAPVIEKGGFTVADFTISKKLLNTQKYGDFTLRGEVQNLLDKKYSYVKGYPMPGRTIFVGLKYSY